MQPGSLKALALLVLNRNSACNNSATKFGAAMQPASRNHLRTNRFPEASVDLKVAKFRDAGNPLNNPTRLKLHSTQNHTILCALPTDLQAFNPSLQELAAYFGEEWDNHCDNPWWLSEAIIMLQERKMIEAGVIPPWFSEKGMCVNCGPVFVPSGTIKDFLVGCPCKRRTGGVLARLSDLL
jgi:hypothetical protein